MNETEPRFFNFALQLTALLVMAIQLSHGSAAHASPVIYDQPPVFPTTPFAALTSTRNPNTLGFVAFDNFTLAQSSTIDGLSWQGYYRDFVTAGNNPISPDTAVWEIFVWSDAAGEPSSPLNGILLTTFDVTATFVAFTPRSGVSVPVYDFHASLPAPLAVNGGQSYWLSILSNAASDDTIWAWMQGSNGDTLSFQDPLPSGSRTTIPTDLRFALEGFAVPEPSGLALLLSGFGLLSFAPARRLCAMVSAATLGGRLNEPSHEVRRPPDRCGRY
jgi:hypothetical protein